MTFLAFFLVICFTTPLIDAVKPRFEVYWESEDSYAYTGAETPWHINLDEIAVGVPGSNAGPSVVTIHAADYCATGCQEYYPDEYCDQYPPEGVPAKPRTVQDWGTKFNITANIMRRGIKKIHESGGKVNLAYSGNKGGFDSMDSGISAENGGGSEHIPEDTASADQLARRIAKNVADWNLDGVDFFYNGVVQGFYWVPKGYEPSYTYVSPGSSAIYHVNVIRMLREFLPQHKTISYTTNLDVRFRCTYDVNKYKSCGAIMDTVIGAVHPHLDFISFRAQSAFDDATLLDMAQLGIPLSKIGGVISKSSGMDEDFPPEDQIAEWVYKIKTRGLAGLSLFSINQENEKYLGAYAEMIAQYLSTI